MREPPPPVEVRPENNESGALFPNQSGHGGVVIWSAAAILLILELSAPSGGLIGLPIAFFLKNKLHLTARALSQFNLVASLPLFAAFGFGFLRDRWMLFGTGDRGYLVASGFAGAGLFAALAFTPPSYGAFLIGIILIGVTLSVAGAAARGLTSATGQKNAITGQAGAVVNLSTVIPGVASFAFGGLLSQTLEGQKAGMAARSLFLVGAAFMGMVAIFGLAGPRRLFAAREKPKGPSPSIMGELQRLFRYRPIYPALLIYGLFQFAPAGGTALQYHLADALHASDTQVGLWWALYYAGFIPGVALFAFLCRRVKLSSLLWIGTVLGIPQFLPFLAIHTVDQSLVVAAIIGVMGGVAQTAYTDLAIRSCPPGLQGTMMMFLITMYAFAYRLGDLWGAYLYDKQGGFATAVVVTTIAYVLIAPLLLFVPKQLISSSDGKTPITSETDFATRT